MRAAAAPAAVTRETFSVFGTTATLLVTGSAAMPAARELADASWPRSTWPAAGSAPTPS